MDRLDRGGRTLFLIEKYVVTGSREKANLNSRLIIFHDLMGVALMRVDGISMMMFIAGCRLYANIQCAAELAFGS